METGGSKRSRDTDETQMVSPDPLPHAQKLSYAGATLSKDPPLTDPPSTSKSTKKQLSTILKSSNRKQHSLFIKIMFPTEATTKDPVKVARTQLVEYFKMLKFVDDDAVLYKWAAERDLGAEACIKPSALPTSLTGIQSFANLFRPKPEGGDLWCDLRVGFNLDPDEFMAELREQASARKWVAKKQALQTSYTEQAGWLLYMGQVHDTDSWANQINAWIDRKISREQGTPPITIGLDFRAIYDGASQEARKRMSQEEKWAKRAVYVICKRGERTRVTGIIRAFLKSPLFASLCNIPSKLIPPLPRGYSQIFQAKYQEATLKHMKCTHFGTASLCSFAFTGPDKPCQLLPDKPSIRSLLLGVKARGTDDPLFLALNPATKSHERGGYVITYQKRYETEAIEKIENLAAFFKHHFGSDSLERFTQEQVNMAEQTVWDTVNDRPITAEELYLEDIMDEDISWVENLNDVTFAKSTKEDLIIERPASSSISQPAFPKSADSDTIVTFHPNQEVARTDDTETGTIDQLSTTTNETDSDGSNAHDEQRATRPGSEADHAKSSDEDLASGV